MSIIVPSNHTRIGAWVNSKMYGRNPLVYCTIRLIATSCKDTKKTVKTKEAMQYTIKHGIIEMARQ